MTQETQTKKKGRPKRADNLPLILSMEVQRSKPSLKVHCEAIDAASYEQYVQFVHEAQPQMSLQEIEARFNALAWSAIWKKDAAFRAWMKEQKQSEAGL